MKALEIGIAIGLAIEILRKVLKQWKPYRTFTKNSLTGKIFDFLVDAVLLASPYASSFGGFVELNAVYWWTAGGLIASLFNVLQARLSAGKSKSNDPGIPEDMSTTSLVGGGLIAGDSLAALSVGIYGLITTVL